jgi:hypothetical protein
MPRQKVPMPVQAVQIVQPQPAADQPLAELLHAPFKTFQAYAGSKFKVRFEGKLPRFVNSRNVETFKLPGRCSGTQWETSEPDRMIWPVKVTR